MSVRLRQGCEQVSKNSVSLSEIFWCLEPDVKCSCGDSLARIGLG